MSEELKNLFSEQLRKCLENSDITMTELAKKIGVSQATISDWCNGKKAPRFNKIEQLANFFNVPATYFFKDWEIAVNPNNMDILSEPSYYTNKETQQLAQEIFDNPDWKILFDTTKDCSPEDMKKVISMVKAFKGEL